MPRTIEVTELILRHAHQSLLATRMALEDMILAGEGIDKTDFCRLECWGGTRIKAGDTVKRGQVVLTWA
jgi:methylmalonyl-CoA carboxyltransferase 5S subunit